MKRTFIFSIALLLPTLFALSAGAQDWPQWRGPNFNGTATATNLPAKFAPSDNVVWAVDLPGPSAATPAIVGDRVFVSSSDSSAKSLLAYCFDRTSGKELWKKEIAKGISQDTRSNFASPSPVTDGKLVTFFYGNGEMVTFDVEGKELWRNNYGPFAFQWTFSTSPLLFNGKIYLQVCQRDTAVNGQGGDNNESYLLAIDPQSGKTLFRHVRPSKAKAESLEAFSTPMPFEYEGRTELIIAAGDALTGHDLETGKELWRWGTWNPGRIPHWRLVPSPIAGDGVVLACAPKRDPIYAVKAGGEGDLDDDALLWTSDEHRELSSDVPTPAFYDGDFFILSDVRKGLSRVEPKTGKIKWTTSTPGRSKYEASPTVADGKIYVINFDGELSVFDAEDGKLLHTAAMDDKKDGVCRACPAIAHDQLFLRTTRKLYCIGKSK